MQQPACSLKAIDTRGFKLERFEAMGLLLELREVHIRLTVDLWYCSVNPEAAKLVRAHYVLSPSAATITPHR